MKQIEAIVDQIKLSEVRNALEEIGVEDFMESTIKCRQKGQTMMFRGATFIATIVEKVRIDIVAADDAVAGIIETIAAIARTGNTAECRITTHPYLEVY